MDHKMKGIIFDMDNTLLRSNIDFEAMRNEIYRFLSSNKILPKEMNLSHHTSSTMIEEGLNTNVMTQSLINEMWDIAKKHEMIGMHKAELEFGVFELLNQLMGKYFLAIVTNNSVEAAERALSDNGILKYFDILVGREMMKSLKPSPDGFLRVLKLYSHTMPEEWISIGDAWVDGKASMDAGITFIAYQGDVLKMNRMGVFPSARINDIRELLHFV